MRKQGWLLITSVMALFSLLGSTMGFSVETLGFYALFIPLMAGRRSLNVTVSAAIGLSEALRQTGQFPKAPV